MGALCRCSADLPLKTLKKDFGSSKQQANLAADGARRITSYGRHTENLAGTAPLNASDSLGSDRADNPMPETVDLRIPLQRVCPVGGPALLCFCSRETGLSRADSGGLGEAFEKAGRTHPGKS